MCLHHPDLLVKVHVGLLGGAACLTTLQITAGLRRLFYLISLNLWFSFCIVFSFFLIFVVILEWGRVITNKSKTYWILIPAADLQLIYLWSIEFAEENKNRNLQRGNNPRKQSKSPIQTHLPKSYSPLVHRTWKKKCPSCSELKDPSSCKQESV